jgi:DNA-binding LacI/PurR family transcriptional regulator
MLKHQEAQKTLLEIASKLQVGEALPSIRSIMEKYNYSQSTITKAIEILEKQGAIERRSRSGIFATGKVHRKDMAALLIAHPLTPTGVEILTGVQTQLLDSSRGLLLLPGGTRDFDSISKLLADNNINEVIISPVSSLLDDMDYICFIQSLIARNCHVVVTDIPIPGVQAPLVGEENVKSFRVLTEQMVIDGARKILVAGKFGSRVYASRLSGIKQVVDKTNIPLQQLEVDNYTPLEEIAAKILSSNCDGVILSDASTSGELLYEMRIQATNKSLSTIKVGAIMEGDCNFVWPQGWKLKKSSFELGKSAVKLLESNVLSNTVKLLPLKLSKIELKP